uniref:RNAse P Rpr2/Rpp21 subunit domain protein n=1 Tax=Musca domestica TaxID=7370 RepID=A0A1I8M0U8_MUSDO
MSQAKRIQKFQGKESFSRMNFLYQASTLMAGKNNSLSAYYGELCKNIAKKSVLKMEPNLKRTFCKRCSLAQEPGTTSELHIKKSNVANKESIDEQSKVINQCLLCGHQRKFIVNMKYKFWLENEEASVAEVFSHTKIE